MNDELNSHQINSVLDEINKLSAESILRIENKEQSYKELTSRLTYGDLKLLSDEVIEEALGKEALLRILEEESEIDDNLNEQLSIEENTNYNDDFQQDDKEIDHNLVETSIRNKHKHNHKSFVMTKLNDLKMLFANDYVFLIVLTLVCASLFTYLYVTFIK